MINLASFFPGDSYSSDESITLYAIWRSKSSLLPSGMNFGTATSGVIRGYIPTAGSGGISNPITQSTLFQVTSLDPTGRWYGVTYLQRYSSSTGAYYVTEHGYIEAKYITLLSDTDLKAHYLSLPGQTTTIESEAFANLPETMAVYIPQTVASIASDAFKGTVAIILGASDSYVQTWAEQNGYFFVVK